MEGGLPECRAAGLRLEGTIPARLIFKRQAAASKTELRHVPRAKRERKKRRLTLLPL